MWWQPYLLQCPVEGNHGSVDSVTEEIKLVRIPRNFMRLGKDKKKGDSIPCLAVTANTACIIINETIH